MALKAGYIGIKKSMLGLINKLGSSKLITSIGNGLTMTTAGKLSANIDTATMEFKNGKLAVKGGAADMAVLYGSLEFTYPASTDTSIELLDSFEDYDLLCVVVGYTGADNSGIPIIIPVDLLDKTTGTATTDRGIVTMVGSNQYAKVAKGVDNTHLTMFYSQGVGIHCVIGIKL